MTILDKKYNVAVKNNEKGECIEIMKVKVVGSEEYQQLIKESNKHKELKEIEHCGEVQKFQQTIKQVYDKLNPMAFLIAKNYFDNLCDRGLCETNEYFESMFENYVDKGIMFDLHSEHIPPQFIKVLERLGFTL